VAVQPTPSPSTSTKPDPDLASRRWILIRDLLAFQAKMLLEGVRDILVVPLALIAAVADLILHGDEPGRLFYQLMRAGRRFDHWLNLFGRGAPRALDERGLDHYVKRLETLIVEQHSRGGVTHQAKEKIDALLQGLADGTGRQGRR
jgi:hypothetical protein